jgi:DNA repair exonuclease
MNLLIQQFVGLFFDSLPYSEEAMNAKASIESALAEKEEALDVETLTADYGSYEKLAALAGCTAEDAARWRSTEKVLEPKAVKKELRRQRRLIWAIAAVCAGLLPVVVWGIYNGVLQSRDFFFSLLYGVALAALAVWLYKRFDRAERQHTDERYDMETYVLLRARSDQNAKRLINSLALLFAVTAMFFGSELSFYFFGNSKSAELLESLFSNLLIVQVPLFLFVKNLLLTRVLQNRIGLPKHEAFSRHVKWFAVASLVYWLLVTLLTVLLRNRLTYPANVFLAAGAIYFLLVLAYDLTLRKRVTFRNLVFDKRRFTLVLVIVLLITAFISMRRETFYTQPYINSLPVVEHRDNKIEYNEQTGVYTITAAGEDFRILHLTDIHLGGSLSSYRKDHKALEACYKEIEATHPDLVIVTGDLSFPLGIMSMSFNNTAPVYQFASFMRNLSIPWAFTYGNHDTESLASVSKEQLDDVYKALSYKTSGTLLYPYVQPEVTGRNNQLIEVRNADGSLMTALFLIDSNAYTGEGINVYDYIHDDQVDWYATEVERLNTEEGRTVDSLVFFHIPLQQYRTAYELYEAGSDEVTYFFGENGEKMIDKVCCSDYPSSLFDRMVELGSTSGTFCGHDHYNNMSLEYRGIRLTYGMSIDYLAMPGIEKDTAQRGAELITILRDGSWDVYQLPLTRLSD